MLWEVRISCSADRQRVVGQLSWGTELASVQQLGRGHSSDAVGRSPVTHEQEGEVVSPELAAFVSSAPHPN